MQFDARAKATVGIGAAQTLAWASSYYLPALLAAPIAAEFAIRPSLVFAAFSAALVVSALVGPLSGKLIDRHGGRPVLIASSLAFALGLVVLACSQGPIGLFSAWLIIGAAMGCGLYDAAFATLVRLYGAQARRSITGVTLMAGFASTIGWPLTAFLEARWGWRDACLAWAAAHVLLNAFLYSRLPAIAAGKTHDDLVISPAEPTANGGTRWIAFLLSFVFAASWFGSTAMAAHLPQLLHAGGAALATAVGIGALVGPSQVGGRIIEFTWLRHHHPLLSARLAALAHPVGVVILLAAGIAAAPVFAVLHGMGNGILTIANGALPLVLFGPKGYGARQGWLMLPARFTQALAPFVFGLALERWAIASLWLTATLGACSFLALMMIKPVSSAPAPKHQGAT